MLKKIISGGQTGVDRAALDVAIAWGMEVRRLVSQGLAGRGWGDPRPLPAGGDPGAGL